MRVGRCQWVFMALLVTRLASTRPAKAVIDVADKYSRAARAGNTQECLHKHVEHSAALPGSAIADVPEPRIRIAQHNCSPHNIVVNSAGLGVMGDGGTAQNVTVVATQ
jgi:hypothetical protein